MAGRIGIIIIICFPISSFDLRPIKLGWGG